MVNQDSTDRSQSTDGSSRQKISPYELLIRQSKKMGQHATKGIDVTKDFLKQDVSVISPMNPDSILFGKKTNHNPGHIDENQAKAIRKVVKRSHDVLAGAKTVLLPMNLFTDSVIVDRTKVTIIKRTFFWNSQVITTRIEDILSVTSNFGPFFGSLMISTRIMNSTDHYDISYFWRKDAEYLKQIIQGYVIAQHNAIETKHLSRSELVETLLELGRDSVL